MSEAANSNLSVIKDKIEKRILILGSTSHTINVSAYAWNKLPKDLNVADYDVVILNLIPLLDEHFASGINLEILPSWQQFARLIFSHQSELVVIGVPNTFLGNNPYVRILNWLPPILPKFVVDSGETIRDINPEFAYYFKHVRQWSFCITSELEVDHYRWTEYLNLIHPGVDNLLFHFSPIAQTRFQQAIALQLSFQPSLTENKNIFSASELSPKVIKPSGKVIWLPPPTEISGEDAINLILQERYGFHFESLAPDWVEKYRLPAELPLEAKIKHCEDAIRNLEKELEFLTGCLIEESRFRKLLYEQGEAALEPVVRDALRQLGAQVEEPLNSKREDGRFIDPKGRKGTLEIKGVTHQLRLREVRQLDQWVRDILIEENLKSKGILIANTFCGIPLCERGEPFPTNCIQAAINSNQCLMTTTQLFNALYLFQKGELDLNYFWDTVFETDGACPLPNFQG